MMGTVDARNMYSFVTKQNFGYLMHLVGYLYEDYHDARSLEHKVLVLRNHTRPILLGLTLLNNHRDINNYTVTFRTPCIRCVCYTFRGCNVRSCTLNTYQTMDSDEFRYQIQSQLGVKQPKCENNHSLPSGNDEFKNPALPHTSSLRCV